MKTLAEDLQHLLAQYQNIYSLGTRQQVIRFIIKDLQDILDHETGVRLLREHYDPAVRG